jgi:hypothetical protein
MKLVALVVVAAGVIQQYLVLHVTAGLVRLALDVMAMQIFRKIAEDAMAMATYM